MISFYKTFPEVSFCTFPNLSRHTMKKGKNRKAKNNPQGKSHRD